MNYYKTIQDGPPYVSLRVSTAKQTYEFAPGIPDGSTSDILCLDFRLSVAGN